jgi:hypothetical protein
VHLHRSLLERVVGARLVYTQPVMTRLVSFEYLNRQLVWQEVSELLLFALPLLEDLRRHAAAASLGVMSAVAGRATWTVGPRPRQVPQGRQVSAPAAVSVLASQPADSATHPAQSAASTTAPDSGSVGCLPRQQQQQQQQRRRHLNQGRGWGSGEVAGSIEPPLTATAGLHGGPAFPAAPGVPPSPGPPSPGPEGTAGLGEACSSRREPAAAGGQAAAPPSYLPGPEPCPLCGASDVLLPVVAVPCGHRFCYYCLAAAAAADARFACPPDGVRVAVFERPHLT